MPSRVALFIDYQNAYRRARGCFGLEANPHPEGQFVPIQLGKRIIEKMPSRDWNLSEVRIYRGLPDSTKDSKGYAAARRQISAWERDPITRVFGRALRYPQGWPGVKAQEKGIDVALAVDFVVMAVRDEYDIGIIMSSDTDLIPALEGVFALNPPRPIPEVAAWTSPTGYSSRLRVRGEKVVCHWLDASDYAAVADPRDYNVVTRASGV